MRPWRTIKHTAIGIVVVFMLTYALFEARGIIAGPHITIDAPIAMQTYGEPVVRLTGTAERVSRLTLNGRDISMSESGTFEEQLVFLPGYNETTLVAWGRFGETTSQTLQNYFIPAWYDGPIE